MPMQRNLYPKNWDEIAKSVKDKANWTCQECGKPCQMPGQSLRDFIERIRTGRMSECPVVADFFEAPTRYVLTVSHGNHEPSDCRAENLRALCSPCHLRYDNQPEQRAIKQRLKKEREGQLTLGV